jgi:hypothetical protein
MGRPSLVRERGRVRAFPRGLTWPTKFLTLILSPSPRGEARKVTLG